jgi:metallophosphoesterase
MKIAHISDIHLGYTSGKKVDPITKTNLREEDGYKALKECFEQIIAEGDIDTVVCTGDFFHSPTPKPKTITVAQNQIRELYKNNIRFVCLAGNHDSTDAVKDIPSSRVLHIPELGIYSYIEPYKIYELSDNIILHLVSHHGYTEQKETMKNVKPIEGKINILCTHGSCYDDNLEMILHSEAEPREVVIPENVLSLDWDYTLLGHIHERGWVSSTDGLTDTANKRVFYGGSLFRRGFSDKDCELGRGWTKWTIDEDTKSMTPEFFTVEQRPQMEVIVNCKDKEAVDIEREIRVLFNKIDFDVTPILRVILIDIPNNKRTQINWKRFEEQTSKCLTFTVKFTTAEQIKKLNISGEIFSFDLIEAYNEFWKVANKSYAEKDRASINSVNNKLLKMGQDRVLDSQK